MQITGQSNGFVYGFDNANRLTSITLGGELVSFSYDTANRRQTLTLPNGVQTIYGFDNANELTGLTYKNSSGTTLGTLVYGYDSAGRRISQTGSWSSNQLPAATTTDYSYNADDQLTGGNGLAPIYDNEGQLLQDGTGSTYNWNVRHQLTSIVHSGVTVASFAYDGLGRRIRKTIAAATTGLLYDGINPIEEVQGSTYNNLLTGLGIDERFARTDSPGRLYYLTDALGSTLVLTTSGAAVRQWYTYDPYGSYTAQMAGGALNNPYYYTGREDDQTGLYYFRARYYNPKAGRFISEDPIGTQGTPNVDTWFEGGQDRYAYADESPVEKSDPLGLCAPDKCKYYSDQCASSGGTDAYACAARKCCESFGDNPKSNCTRGCLIDTDRANCAKLSGSARNHCRFNAHVKCYTICVNFQDLSKKPWTLPTCQDAMKGMGGAFGG